jgi:hypothetical protein
MLEDSCKLFRRSWPDDYTSATMPTAMPTAPDYDSCSATVSAGSAGRWQNAGEITVTIKNAGQKKSWAEGTAPDVTHIAGENSWLKIMARTEPGRELGRSEESLEVETGNY